MTESPRTGRPSPAEAAIEDAALMARLTDGDHAALGELYDRYSRVVYSYLLRVVGDVSTAEELLQEVFFRAWKQSRTYAADKGAFVAWVLSIAHNLAIDELRRQSRRPRSGSEDAEAALAAIPDESATPEGDAWLSSLRATIVAALGELPEAQRTTIELAYFGGLTQREAAERLNVPIGTIKTRTRLGLLKLREHLQPILGDLFPETDGEDEEGQYGERSTTRVS